jgi:tetratricopeptide (TPR) repeat protein/tRNA A-37 threonylcarbamoyl transferase component Bud32
MSEPSEGDTGPLPSALARRVDAACDQYESAWRSGQRPRIEDVLEDFPEAARPSLLRGLLGLELAYRRLAGEVPDPETYRLRFPAHPTEVHEALADASTSPAGIDGPPTTGEGAAREASAGPDADRHAAMDPAPPGARYHILRPHARGGLGEVYLARDEQLRRVVALKEIQAPQADRADSRARFVREAEITGGLEHPGIVPVYELGRYRDGRPYYAMRFIEGESLREAIGRYHAEGRRLSPGERSLELRGLLGRFVDACNAVAYAHSRGVIHRDLKPANIMLGPFGETLVVDWGLAKPSAPPDPAGSPEGGPGPSAAGGEEDTLPGVPVGTPQYMSPEQAAGEPGKVGAASDVYGLGATLYCLLTGRPPFEDRDVTTVLQRVARGDLPPPRQARRDVPPALEAICLKAMATRPEDRYESVRALAADVERWLAGEPVSAWREPWARRAGRWASRHRTAVATATAALVMAAVGLAAVTAVQTKARHDLAVKNTALGLANAELDVERRRAEDRETRAIEAVRRFREVVAQEPALKYDPALGDLRRRLLKEPLVFFRSLRDRLLADRDTRPEALLRLGQASFDLADITAEVGDQADALAAFRDSLANRQRLADAHPDDAGIQSKLAAAHCRIGVLLRATGRADEALAAYRSGLSIQRVLADAYPTFAGYRKDLATTQNNIGNLLRTTGRPDEARRAFEAALALQRELVAAHPGSAEFQSDLATSYNNLGILLRETGKPAEALAAYRSALALQRALADAAPDGVSYRLELARSHDNVGNLLRATGRPAEALAAYQSGLLIQRKLVEVYPSVVRFQDELARGHNNVGLLMQGIGQPAEALKAFETARTIRQALADAHPGVASFRSDLARTHSNIGTLHRATGRRAEALAAYQAALGIQRTLADASPTLRILQRDLAATCNNLGDVLHATGRRAEARKAFAEALSIQERIARGAPESPDSSHALGVILGNIAMIDLGLKRFDEARAGLARAVTLQKKALAAYPRHPSYLEALQDHLGDLASAELGLGRIGPAREAARERRKISAGRPASLYRSACALARCASHGDDPSESARDAAEAMATLKEAAAAGWNNPTLAASDSDLTALRGRADFQQLLATLFDRAMPSDPFVRP